MKIELLTKSGAVVDSFEADTFDIEKINSWLAPRNIALIEGEVVGLGRVPMPPTNFVIRCKENEHQYKALKSAVDAYRCMDDCRAKIINTTKLLEEMVRTWVRSYRKVGISEEDIKAILGDCYSLVENIPLEEPE